VGPPPSLAGFSAKEESVPQIKACAYIGISATFQGSRCSPYQHLSPSQTPRGHARGVRVVSVHARVMMAGNNWHGAIPACLRLAVIGSSTPLEQHLSAVAAVCRHHILKALSERLGSMHALRKHRTPWPRNDAQSSSEPRLWLAPHPSGVHARGLRRASVQSCKMPGNSRMRGARVCAMASAIRACTAGGQ
jgi:hypothetical protein